MFTDLVMMRFLQSETEQRPHKVSFYVKKEHAQEVIKDLSGRLVKRGVRLLLGQEDHLLKLCGICA